MQGVPRTNRPLFANSRCERRGQHRIALSEEVGEAHFDWQLRLHGEPVVVGSPAEVPVARRDIRLEPAVRQRDPDDVAVHLHAAARGLADEDRLRRAVELRREVSGGGERCPADEDVEMPAAVDLRAAERDEERPERRVVAAAVQPQVDDHAVDLRALRQLLQARCRPISRHGDRVVADEDRPPACERPHPEELAIVCDVHRRRGVG